MRIFFIGSQEYGLQAFKKILKASEESTSKIKLVGAISLEPAPHEVWEDNIKKLAFEKDIPFKTVKDHLTLEAGSAPTINNEEYVEFVKEKKPDLVFVFGWRQLIGKKIRQLPTNGVIGIHYSLLPKYRGHAPISWALINDEKNTGLSLFYFGAGVDCGDVLMQKKVPILDEDTIGTLRKKVNHSAMKCIDELISYIQQEDRLPTAKPQCEEEATITAYRLPQHAIVDWSKSDREVYNLIRASSEPYSGAYTFLDNHKVTIWAAELLPTSPKYIGLPGQILKNVKKQGIIVKTGENAILVKRMQMSATNNVPPGALKDTRRMFGRENNVGY